MAKEHTARITNGRWAGRIAKYIGGWHPVYWFVIDGIDVAMYDDQFTWINPPYRMVW